MLSMLLLCVDEKSAQTNAATICKKLREDYFVFIHFSFIRRLATTARCCVLCAVDATEESIGKKEAESGALSTVIARCNEK